MMSNVLRLLCQTFMSIILIKLIYCLMVPKAIRNDLSKIGVSVSKLICSGLNEAKVAIPKPQQVSVASQEEKPNLRIVK